MLIINFLTGAQKSKSESLQLVTRAACASTWCWTVCCWSWGVSQYASGSLTGLLSLILPLCWL